MRLALPDLISNSYFPAVAAIELGFFRKASMSNWKSSSQLTRLVRRCVADRWIWCQELPMRRLQLLSFVLRRKVCTGSWSCERNWARAAAN
jgi:hypothetical protein